MKEYFEYLDKLLKIGGEYTELMVVFPWMTVSAAKEAFSEWLQKQVYIGVG